MIVRERNLLNLVVIRNSSNPIYEIFTEVGELCTFPAPREIFLERHWMTWSYFFLYDDGDGRYDG